MRIGLVKLLVTAGLSMVGAILAPLGVGVAAAQPSASFSWTPQPVVAGAPVTFESTLTPQDADTPITSVVWLAGGLGICLDVLSPTCTTTAPSAPGDWTVTLTVLDILGGSASVTETIPVVAPPPPPPPPNTPPDAAFAALPSSPIVGEEVTFVSYSDDADGRVTSHEWDLNGDGSFSDATGAIATRRFSAPGERTVTLRVRDNDGAASTLSLTLQVREQASGSQADGPPSGSAPALTGPSPLPDMLSPFPIVRLAGSVTGARTQVKVLAVRAPKGAQVLARCRGRRCPVKRAQKLVGRVPVRLKAAERVFPTGVVLEVLVRRGDRIGKFTRFKFRRNRPPLRSDGCLWPNTSRMAPCPET
jgi:PKD domain